tara:strand:- start:43 stop:273 length:231 start_codon:yes stop_codon:yes gene_type:complete
MNKNQQIKRSWSEHITRQKWLEGMGGEEYDYRHRQLGIEPKNVMSIDFDKYKIDMKPLQFACPWTSLGLILWGEAS